MKTDTRKNLPRTILEATDSDGITYTIIAAPSLRNASRLTLTDSDTGATITHRFACPLRNLADAYEALRRNA